MPVLRGYVRPEPLDQQRRTRLLQALQQELSGGGVQPGLIIFEIPIGDSRIDVLVIWSEWEGVLSQDRTSIILNAYPAERHAEIAQAQGMTYEEAIENQLLPYSVAPMCREREVDPDAVRGLMLEYGGIELPGQKVILRAPTMSIAESIHKELQNRLPGAHWSISRAALTAM